MKRTRLYVYTKKIDSNYSAHKGYITIPLNVQNIKSICPVLHNAEGYLSVFKEIDEEQILNEMRIEDDRAHLNSKKVAVSVSPDNSDFKFVLRLTKIFNNDVVRYNYPNGYEEYLKDLKAKNNTDPKRTTKGKRRVKQQFNSLTGEMSVNKYKTNVYKADNCTLKIIIEYEEDV